MDNMEKYTFEQLEAETQEQIMFELCDIGQMSKSWGEIAEIEARAKAWLAENNEPKTYDEWQELVVSREDNNY
jgi:hypothetical protein